MFPAVDLRAALVGWCDGRLKHNEEMRRLREEHDELIRLAHIEIAKEKAARKHLLPRPFKLPMVRHE